jgi:hypothetical protein
MPDLAITASREQHKFALSVLRSRVNGQIMHRLGMTLQFVNRFRGLQIPDNDRSVRGSRDEHRFTRDGGREKTFDEIRVAGKSLTLARLEIGTIDVLVPAA